MNAQIIEDILNQAKVDKNGRIMNKGRLNDMLHSEHLKAVKKCSIPDVVCPKGKCSRYKDLPDGEVAISSKAITNPNWEE